MSLCSPELSTANSQAATMLGADGASAPPYSARCDGGAGLGQIGRKRCDHQHGFKPSRSRMTAAWMNAEDMNEPLCWLVYRPEFQVKRSRSTQTRQ